MGSAENYPAGIVHSFVIPASFPQLNIPSHCFAPPSHSPLFSLPPNLDLPWILFSPFRSNHHQEPLQTIKFDEKTPTPNTVNLPPDYSFFVSPECISHVCRSNARE